jgi:MFS family permease
MKYSTTTDVLASTEVAAMQLLVQSLIADGPSLRPDANQLPGASVLQSLADGIGGWALIAAMLGLVVGAITWAFGHYSHNYQQAYNGRRGVMVSALAAVLIGGAPQIIKFFLNKGGNL